MPCDGGLGVMLENVAVVDPLVIELNGDSGLLDLGRSLPKGPFGVCVKPEPPMDCDTHASEGSSSSRSISSTPTSLMSADVNSGSKLLVDSSNSTTGLKGGVTCFKERACQSIFLKNGCSFSSAASRWAPSLCLGFRLRSYG